MDDINVWTMSRMRMEVDLRRTRLRCTALNGRECRTRGYSARLLCCNLCWCYLDLYEDSNAEGQTTFSIKTLDTSMFRIYFKLTRASVPDARIVNMTFTICMDVAEEPARDDRDRVLRMVDASKVRELSNPVIWES